MIQSVRKLLAAIAVLGMVACGSDDGDDSSETTTSVGSVTPTGAASATSTSLPPFGGSSAPVFTPDSAKPATLTGVAIGVHEGFERIVFRFSDHVPGIRLQPSPGPFAEDGSDKTLTIEGNAFLALRMTANGHTEAGESTAPKRTNGPKGHSITEVVRAGDFEGVLSFVIGLEAPQTFRAFQTNDPPRIVIDISSR